MVPIYVPENVVLLLFPVVLILVLCSLTALVEWLARGRGQGR